MSIEIKKRVFTSIFLLILLTLALFYSFVLIVLLILVILVSWIEFKGLINKIIIGKEFLKKILRSAINAVALLYLFYFSSVIFNGVIDNQINYKFQLIYLLSICICSDIGGLVFGKIFKGKKLTKISPNKTINGAIGSFILPLILIPLFFNFYSEKFYIFNLIILTLTVSFICQLGDLFISFLKRKANVKDTSDLLPGHGGVLDRIDGIIFAIPFGFILWKFLI